jgi:thioredoxin-like negative regulator of GroEL
LALAADGQDVEGLRAAVDGGDVTARVPLGRALAATGRHEEAVAVLLDAVRDPATREEGREALVAVFTALGGDHPLVKAARPKLAAALF